MLELATEIKQEHQRAEIERLRSGYDGCGCSDCQELYTIINLPKYGRRVIYAAEAIIITAGRYGADLWDKYHQSDNPPLSAQDKREPVTNEEQGEMYADEPNNQDVTTMLQFDVTQKCRDLASEGKSTRQIADILQSEGVIISHMTVARKLQRVLI